MSEPKQETKQYYGWWSNTMAKYLREASFRAEVYSNSGSRAGKESGCVHWVGDGVIHRCTSISVSNTASACMYDDMVCIGPVYKGLWGVNALPYESLPDSEFPIIIE